MSGILPDAGTVYTSLPAFKLDVFERGLRNSLHFAIKSATSNRCSYVHCAIKTGTEKQFCSFRVVAKNIEGVITVTDITTEHSCEGHDTETKRIEARRKMKEMVEKARGEKEEFEKGRESEGDKVTDSGKGQHTSIRGRPESSQDEQGSNNYEFGQESEEEDEDFSNDLSTNHFSSSATLSKGDDDTDEDAYSDHETSESDEDLYSESTFGGSPSSASKPRNRGRRMSSQDLRTMFPPARDRQQDIDELKKTTLVYLPSSETSFDSPRHLLVVLYAFALQRNFSIYRKYPDATIVNPKSLRMHCHRSDSKYASKGGCCRYTLHGSKNQDGTWKFDSVSGSHNHGIKHLSNDVGLASHSTKRKIDYIETSKPQLSLPTDSNSSLTPHASTSHSTQHSTSYSPYLAASHFTQQQLLPPLNPIPSTYSSDLVHFLRTFKSTPMDLPHLLSKLDQSGIGSVETLLEVLMMENESLEKFLGMLDDHGVGMKIVEMVKEIRSVASYA